MAISKHFTNDEALAIQKLSSAPEWELLKAYLYRRAIVEMKECIIHKEPHMIYRSQGAAVVLDELHRLDEKAKHFLEGV